MGLEMLNVQSAEPVTADNEIDVVRIWHTIQGEGPFAGSPAVFVRMAGCNLTCNGCDTDYTTGRKKLTVEQVADRIVKLIPTEHHLNYPLVVLTGGEPFRQCSLAELVRYLASFNYRVQIETNGTLHHVSFPYLAVTLVVSPKTPSINQEMIRQANCFKYILRAGEVDPLDGLPTKTLGVHRPWRPSSRDSRPIFLQPEDQGDPALNAANVRAAVKSCMKFGYRFSLQIHKVVGVD